MQSIYFCHGLDIRVPQIVEANDPHVMLLQHLGERGGQVGGLDPLTDLVHADVAEEIGAVRATAKPTIDRLFLMKLKQHFPEVGHKRQCT